MKRYKRRSIAVKAFQVTPETFTDIHSIPIPPVYFDPVRHTASFSSGASWVTAECGNWVVLGSDGLLTVLTDDMFHHLYELEA